MTASPDRAGLLERIRRETREAVIEGDASDCSSPDCIADAVYEIVRTALAATGDSEGPGLDVTDPRIMAAWSARLRDSEGPGLRCDFKWCYDCSKELAARRTVPYDKPDHAAREGVPEGDL